MRIAVIGDVSGNLPPLAAAVDTLGGNVAAGTLPEDLVIVQVGDLIHKGPDSRAVIDAVDTLIDRYPDQWIQLVGNHEAHHLPEGPKFWPGPVDTHVTGRLLEWVDRDRMTPACGVVTDDGRQVLITHAGLTRDFHAWVGRPATVPAAIAVLDELWATARAAVLAPGRMLYGYQQWRMPAGPVWADPVHELLLPWQDAGRMPFDQIHGHASAYNWYRQRYHHGFDGPARDGMRVDPDARHTTWTHPDGHTIIGCDPGVGRICPIPAFTPVLLHGRLLG